MIAEQTGKLIRTALTRAYFCEQLALTARTLQEFIALFLMACLSTGCATGPPNEQSPAELSLSAEIRTALGGLEARLGTL